MTPRLTQAGYEIMTRALAGEKITFTKIEIGNGNMPDDYLSANSLGNTMQTIGIDSIDIQPQFAVLTGNVNNSDITSGFQWTEIGIFCAGPDDGEDILYAYGHYQMNKYEQPTYIPAYGANVVELTLNEYIYIGDADNVSAALATNSAYAKKADLEAHETDEENPHHVTAEQVGLGNVPDVNTNDQTPTFEEAKFLTKLTSGATLSILFGKLAKAVSSLIDHIADTTKHITAEERTDWNSKAARSHTHAASDINSGTLGVERGGTGATTADAARKAIIGGSAIGSATNPVYWDGSVFAKTTYTLGKSVPADAKFTDTNTTYGAATQSAAGLLSAADKKKLDGIAAGANAYSLPTAGAGTKGGVQLLYGQAQCAETAKGSTSNTKVSFGGTFSGVPKVFATIIGQSTTGQRYGAISVIVCDVSTGGFTIHLSNASDGSVTPYVNWLAVYRG